MRKRKYSVLVVDDEENIRELLETMLGNFMLFNSIILSDSAQDATKKIINQEFDIIIIDNQMPNRSGLEWIRNVILHPNVKKQRIIFMSGVMQDNDVLMAFRYGVKNFLVKPFMRKKLYEIIVKILKL